eukprot:SAG22_NODE_19056_length_278_cov_1.145251_1_plen_68_part_10
MLCSGLNRLKDLLSKDITDTKDKIHVRSPPAKRSRPTTRAEVNCWLQELDEALNDQSEETTTLAQRLT